MSDDTKHALKLSLSFVLIYAIGWMSGFFSGEAGIEKKAIEAGAAHYECDPATGVTRLVWGERSE